MSSRPFSAATVASTSATGASAATRISSARIPDSPAVLSLFRT